MKKALIFSASFLMLLILIAMIPIPKATLENMEKVKGLVGDIYTSGANHIIVKLVDDDSYYYISKNGDRGIDYTTLKQKLLYHDVEIGYVKNWSIFGNISNMKPVCLVEKENKIVFTSLQD